MCAVMGGLRGLRDPKDRHLSHRGWMERRQGWLSGREQQQLCRVLKDKGHELRKDTELRRNVYNLNQGGGCRGTPVYRYPTVHGKIKSAPGRGNGLYKGLQARKIYGQASPTPSGFLEI